MKTLVTCVLLFTLFANCDRGDRAMGPPQPPEAPEVPDLNLACSTEGATHVVEHRLLKNGYGVNAINFLDATHGWAVIRERIYHTEDGGVSWRLVSAAGPFSDTDQNNANFAWESHPAEVHLAFESTAVGWMGFSQSEGLAYTTAKVFETRDGGKSWKSVFNNAGMSLTSMIRGNTPGEVFLFGLIRTKESNVIEPVLIRRNGVGEWISDTQSLPDIDVQYPKNVLASRSNDESFVLLLCDRMYRSADGVDWKMTEPPGIAGGLDESKRTAIAENKGLIALLTGTWGREGMESSIFIYKNGKLVAKMRRNQLYLSDLAIQDDGTIVASGSIEEDDVYTGIALVSSDEGKTWNYLVRTNRAKVLSRIVALAGGSLIFAGSNGNVFRYSGSSNHDFRN